MIETSEIVERAEMQTILAQYGAIGFLGEIVAAESVERPGAFEQEAYGVRGFGDDGFQRFEDVLDLRDHAY
jgi:hypothetical protein